MSFPPILVTGGAGYIGAHTCKLLKARGYMPVVVDNLVYGHKDFVKWGPLYEGEISDTQLLDHLFTQYKPHAVIHFAAYAYVGESVSDPEKYYLNNVMATLSLLTQMRKHQCLNLVFSSSCAVYGIPDSVPILETAPTRPMSPYGKSKWMVEQMLQDFSIAYGLRSVSLRYFNAAGADPLGEIGESHDPETHLIPLAIAAALGKMSGKNSELQLFGKDYPTPDGTAIRDYIHVCDLASAHHLSLEFLKQGGATSAFNLGTGRGHSVQEVITTVEKVSSRSVPFVVCPRRSGDPPILFADASAACRVLGWKPEYSDLQTQIEHAFRWHQLTLS